MKLDSDTCYRAMASRDHRFEGRFVTGVVTTGVYCRPGCPARVPLRKNVRFFACAAAAEENGFRPCFRCRPDLSPGTPAVLGSSVTVSRALRLMAAPDFNGSNLETLAERLGITSRQLRRLFLKHLGASPRAVLMTRRAHFARKLIDETALPMTEIALSSGFASVRRFNDAFRRTFRSTPTQVRRSLGSRAPASDEGLKLRLPFRPPLDWEGLLDFLRLRAIPGVEVVSGDAYRRTLEVDGAAGWLEIRPGSSRHLEMTLRLPAYTDLMGLAARAGRIFDLAADPMEITSHLRRDPWLAGIIDTAKGVRVPGAWDPFELVVRGILGQQVPVKAASTLIGRLVRAHGRPLALPAGEGLTHLFPKPADLADADIRSIGVPGNRARTLRELAHRVADGGLSLDEPRGLEESVAGLSAVPGIGPWTAHYIAMRGLSEPDAFPAGDLVLIRAARRQGVADLVQRAEVWRPWRAYAVMALWRAEAASPPFDRLQKKENKAHENPKNRNRDARRAVRPVRA